LNDRVDLHLHSTASDGVLSPTELAVLVQAAGVRLCALTDHDTTDGLAEMAQAALAVGLQTLPGIELSAAWQGRDIHIVGLGFDLDHAALHAAIATRRQLRHQRLLAMAARMDRAGAPGQAALERLASVSNPTRTHLARALVELGAAVDLPAAFNRWLGRGKPGYVPTEWPSVDATVSAIVDAGGCAVLAHPLRYMLSAGQRRTLVKQFKAVGGTALEIVTGGAAPHQVATALGLALRAGLEGSSGSDCHNPALPWQRPGRLATLPEAVAPVWRRWDAVSARAVET
jgi:3',5'-nucleoside bisphosphate phosphatase